MFKSGKTKNLIAATNKPNLLPMLEDLQKRSVKNLSLLFISKLFLRTLYGYACLKRDA